MHERYRKKWTSRRVKLENKLATAEQEGNRKRINHLKRLIEVTKRKLSIGGGEQICG